MLTRPRPDLCAGAAAVEPPGVGDLRRGRGGAVSVRLTAPSWTSFAPSATLADQVRLLCMLLPSRRGYLRTVPCWTNRLCRHWARGARVESCGPGTLWLGCKQDHCNMLDQFCAVSAVGRPGPAAAHAATLSRAAKPISNEPVCPPSVPSPGLQHAVLAGLGTGRCYSIFL